MILEWSNVILSDLRLTQHDLILSYLMHMGIRILRLKVQLSVFFGCKHRFFLQKIDFWTLGSKSFFVLFLGFGFWLFPFLFICPIISYVSLLKRKKTQWDRLLKLEVTHNELTPTRIISAIFSFILVINLVGILLLPPEQISP